MRAGKLRHRLLLRSNTPAYDANGQPVDSYTAVATVWGSVSPLDGRETEFANKVTAEATHVVVIRYNSNVDTEYQITHDSRTLQVVSIVNKDDRDIQQTVLCKELL